jgi:thiosulfate/3-mercaptopyruvate sulfurtransferase
VLDGGWSRWLREGHESHSGPVSRSARRFTPRLCPELAIDATGVLAARDDPKTKLFDSRSADRYRGENEAIDPVAGHIPGAASAPYVDNLTADGSFRSPEELRQRFRSLLGDTRADRAVFYCGSGVTAAHSVLALEHAGLGTARLYAGSWSEWITDANRPVATGADP